MSRLKQARTRALKATAEDLTEILQITGLSNGERETIKAAAQIALRLANDPDQLRTIVTSAPAKQAVHSLLDTNPSSVGSRATAILRHPIARTHGDAPIPNSTAAINAITPAQPSGTNSASAAVGQSHAQGQSQKNNAPVNVQLTREQLREKYPKHNTPWHPNDKAFLENAITVAKSTHGNIAVQELSQLLGRTPYSVALKAVALGYADAAWAEKFKV